MSNRIRRLSKLREFNKVVMRMSPIEMFMLEKEYERLTGMECDEAAKAQTKEQFIESIKAAYESVRKLQGYKRRIKNDEELTMYA
jgi:hypothetical protein